MTARSAPTARPPWALTCWVDDNAVYTELPSTNGGPPYIQRHPLTEAGFSKALWLARDAFNRSKPSAPINYTMARPPRHFTPASGFTDDQRAAAREALRKAGIL